MLPALNETDVKRRFVEAFCRYLRDRDAIIANLSHFTRTCLDPAGLEKKRDAVTEKLAAMTHAEFSKPPIMLAVIISLLFMLSVITITVIISFIPRIHSGLLLRIHPSRLYHTVNWRIFVEKVLVGSNDTITFHIVGGKKYSFRIY